MHPPLTLLLAAAAGGSGADAAIAAQRPYSVAPVYEAYEERQHTGLYGFSIVEAQVYSPSVDAPVPIFAYKRDTVAVYHVPEQRHAGTVDGSFIIEYTPPAVAQPVGLWQRDTTATHYREKGLERGSIVGVGLMQTTVAVAPTPAVIAYHPDTVATHRRDPWRQPSVSGLALDHYAAPPVAAEPSVVAYRRDTVATHRRDAWRQPSATDLALQHYAAVDVAAEPSVVAYRRDTTAIYHKAEQRDIGSTDGSFIIEYTPPSAPNAEAAIVAWRRDSLAPVQARRTHHDAIYGYGFAIAEAQVYTPPAPDPAEPSVVAYRRDTLATHRRDAWRQPDYSRLSLAHYQPSVVVPAEPAILAVNRDPTATHHRPDVLPVQVQDKAYALVYNGQIAQPWTVAHTIRDRLAPYVRAEVMPVQVQDQLVLVELPAYVPATEAVVAYKRDTVGTHARGERLERGTVIGVGLIEATVYTPPASGPWTPAALSRDTVAVYARAERLDVQVQDRLVVGINIVTVAATTPLVAYRRDTVATHRRDAWRQPDAAKLSVAHYVPPVPPLFEPSVVAYKIDATASLRRDPWRQPDRQKLSLAHYVPALAVVPCSSATGNLLDSWTDTAGNTTYSSTNQERVGQSFQTGPEISQIYGVCVRLIRVGSPQGTFKVAFKAHSGTYGTSSVPTGSAIAESAIYDPGTVSNAVGGTAYWIPCITPLTPSGSYCTFEVDMSNVIGDASNYLGVRVDAVGAGHDGNNFYYNRGGGSYTPSSTQDAWFRLYGLRAYESSLVAHKRDTLATYYRRYPYPLQHQELSRYHYTVSIGGGVTGDLVQVGVDLNTLAEIDVNLVRQADVGVDITTTVERILEF